MPVAMKQQSYTQEFDLFSERRDQLAATQPHCELHTRGTHGELRTRGAHGELMPTNPSPLSSIAA